MKISIIIPLYNSEKYINKTLDSIKCQTYKNIEIIIVDDGSTDDSINKILDYKQKNEIDFRILKQYNQNASIARNRALEVATGDYVLFIDSDDELYCSTVLESIIEQIGDFDLLVGDYIIVDENSKYISSYENIPTLNVNSQFKYLYNNPLMSNKLYKMSIIKKYNLFFSNVRIGQDLNFYLKYLLHSPNIKYFHENLFKYRIASNSMSRCLNNYNFLDIYNSFELIRKYYVYYEANNEVQDYIIPASIFYFSGKLTKVNKLKYLYEKKYIYSSFKFFVKKFESYVSRKKSKELRKKLNRYYLILILSKFHLYY